MYFVSVIQLELKQGSQLDHGKSRQDRMRLNVHLSGGNGDGTGDKGTCLGLGLGGMVSGFRLGKPCGCYSQSLR